MNWKFWEKKVESVPRRLEIPAEHVLELYVLYEKFWTAPNNQDYVARYYVWDFITEIFPEVRNGSWRIDTDSALTIHIVEIPKDKP